MDTRSVTWVMSDSLGPDGLQPARLLCPWHSPWFGLSCPPPGNLPDAGIEHTSPVSPALQWILYRWTTGEAHVRICMPEIQRQQVKILVSWTTWLCPELWGHVSWMWRNHLGAPTWIAGTVPGKKYKAFLCNTVKSSAYEPSSRERSKMQTCSLNVRSNCSLPSISYGWQSCSTTISCLLSLLEWPFWPAHSTPGPAGQPLP